jgi:FtsH-binding integral membrane protein
MIWLQFALQVLPLSALSLLATSLGFSILPFDVTSRWTLPLLWTGVLLFVALTTFKETPGWNIGLLLAFALVAGCLISGLKLGSRPVNWPSTLLIMTTLLALSAVVGGKTRGRAGWLGMGLWALTWVYLAGWGLISLLHLGGTTQILWASAGTILFCVLSAIWFSELEARLHPGSGAALAVELYILALNLAFAVHLLRAHAN